MRKKQLVKGVEYIRIAPTKYGDYSRTDSAMCFDGIAPDGCYLMHYPKGSLDEVCFGTEVQKMPTEFSDNNWRPANNPIVGVKSSLHKWKGQLVRRIRPAGIDLSYMDRPVRLVSATRYHVVVAKPESGYELVLDIRYANPDDWELFNP